MIPVKKQSGDICSADAPITIKCPAAAGEQTVYGKFDIPAVAPKGNYKVTIKASTKAGAELFCLNLNFALGETEEEVYAASKLR